MRKRLIIIIIVFTTISLVFCVNLYKRRQIIMQTDLLISCYRSGGHVNVFSGRPGPIGCEGLYPKTKLDRIQVEEYPESRACITSISPAAPHCICKKGNYFGSYEEGCIPLSDKKSVIKIKYY